MEHNSSETDYLIERSRVGDGKAINELFTRHRKRLCRMVEMRLDHRLQARIDASDVIQVDREVLALHHFEELTSAEAAQVLDIEEEAAAKRYVRALRWLKKILAMMPGGVEEP